MKEGIQESSESLEKSQKRIWYKFLVKVWPDSSNLVDVNDLPKEEAERLAASNQQTKELLQSEFRRLDNEFSEEEKRRLRSESLEEQVRGWRQLLTGRPESEIEEAIGRIKKRWNDTYS